MTETLAVAMYAAIVSTGALAWQIASWTLKERTRLRVTAELLPAGTPSFLNLRLVNRSGHTVRIETVTVLAGVWRIKMIPWMPGVATRCARVYKRLRGRPDAVVRLVVDRTYDNVTHEIFLRALSELPKEIGGRSSARIELGGERFTTAFPQPDGLLVQVETGEGRRFTAKAQTPRWLANTD